MVTTVGHVLGVRNGRMLLTTLFCTPCLNSHAFFRTFGPPSQPPQGDKAGFLPGGPGGNSIPRHAHRCNASYGRPADQGEAYPQAGNHLPLLWSKILRKRHRYRGAASGWQLLPSKPRSGFEAPKLNHPCPLLSITFSLDQLCLPPCLPPYAYDPVVLWRGGTYIH